MRQVILKTTLSVCLFLLMLGPVFAQALPQQIVVTNAGLNGSGTTHYNDGNFYDHSGTNANGTYNLVTQNGRSYYIKGTNTSSGTVGPAFEPSQKNGNVWAFVAYLHYDTGYNADQSGYGLEDYLSATSNVTSAYHTGDSTGTAPPPVVAASNGFAALVAPSVSVNTSSITATAMTLNWTSAVGGNGTNNYQLQRATETGNTPVWSNVGPNSAAQSYTDTGLAPGTQYDYQVIVTDTETTPQTATSSEVTNITNFAALTSVSPVTLLPDVSGDLITVPAGAFASSGLPIASVSLFAGTSSGHEGHTPVATLTSPVFPVTFPPQPRASAGQATYYTVSASNGFTSSAPSNEMRSAATAIVPSGSTAAQTFTASYGPAYSGLAIGYTVYDPTGAVIVLHKTAGVGEIPGSGIYSASVPLDAADYGSFVWDAPAGAAPIVQSFSVPAAGGGGGGASAAAVVAAIKADPVMSRTFNRSKQLYTYNVTTHVMTLLNDDGSPFASITLGYDNATGYLVSRH